MIARELLEEVSRAHPGTRVALARASWAEADGIGLHMAFIGGRRALAVSGPAGAEAGFEGGQEFRAAGMSLRLFPLTHGRLPGNQGRVQQGGDLFHGGHLSLCI